MGDLVSSFEPVDEVEVEVMPAGTAVDEERRDRDESDQRKQEEWPAIMRHRRQSTSDP
jgi:hypothetical protein